MAEEKIDNSTPTSDDLNVLRVLLHNINGISAVSTAPNYMPIMGEDAVAAEN
ncbi:MAG TPA: hypothetical protein VGO98_02295 [Candidatus Saccharimonadales bacterium]|jgi:hypothetical protein|nr:hypothetical protein [Candidatus Saccharimonadales bacterium]